MTQNWVRRAPPGLVFAAGRARRSRVWAVLVKTIAGSWRDGFVHAGNIAYLSLLTLFPFFIVVASIAGILGRTDDGLLAVQTFLHTLPRDVATLIAKPIRDVIAARSNSGLLTFGIIVTLWTVSGFIETIRDIIRRSYEAIASVPVWRYRLASVLLIIGAVMLMIVAFVAQVLLTGAEEFVFRLFPLADGVLRWLGIGRLAPALTLFVALYLVF